MNLKGTVTIHAPKQKVWNFLTDPKQVAACAPGVDSVEEVEPEKFRAVASVGFGAVKATFVTDAQWLGLEPPDRAQTKFHGKAPGSVVDGRSEMILRDGDQPGETVLQWSADVTVVGTIASLAARLIHNDRHRVAHDASAGAEGGSVCFQHAADADHARARTEERRLGDA